MGAATEPPSVRRRRSGAGGSAPPRPGAPAPAPAPPRGAGGVGAGSHPVGAQLTLALNELVFIPWPPFQISKPASIDFR